MGAAALTDLHEAALGRHMLRSEDEQQVVTRNEDGRVVGQRGDQEVAGLFRPLERHAHEPLVRVEGVRERPAPDQHHFVDLKFPTNGGQQESGANSEPRRHTDDR